MHPHPRSRGALTHFYQTARRTGSDDPTMGNHGAALATRNPLPVLIPIAVGAFLLGRWSSSAPRGAATAATARLGAAAAGKARAPAKGAFWLVVAVVFQQERDVVTFEKAFQPLADYVQSQELGTLSYAYAQSDSDPKRILIFERYATKADYLDVHKVSEPFLAFRPQLAALNAKIEGHSYIEGGLGFV